MESHRHIEEEAALLLAKRDSGDWSESDEARLAQWFGGSAARRVAFLRLEAIWEDARRLKALRARRPAQSIPAIGEWREAPFFAESGELDVAADEQQSIVSLRASARGRRQPGGVRSLFATLLHSVATAAAVLAVVAVSGYVYMRSNGISYSTPTGGFASVPLRDGSQITLDTTTRINVQFTKAERQVRLERGEAYFAVAKDPRRPFVVDAGRERIIAIGTQFSVSRQGDEVRVEVTEGRVMIARSNSGDVRLAIAAITQDAASASPGGLDDDKASGAVLLTPGNIAEVHADAIRVQPRSLTEVEDDLSWRRGYLTFRDTPLGDAIGQLNRYNTHRIRIDDQRIAAIRISGSFRPQDYEAFIRLMGEGFGIRATTREEETVLTE